MKYPPYSWLRLSEEIKQAPSRVWFALNKLPNKTETCTIKVHIGGANTSIADPYEALSQGTSLLPSQQKVLERFLKIAKPSKNKSEFIVDYASLSSILSYCSAIPFEIMGEGVISVAEQNACIQASLIDNEDETTGKSIEFSLMVDGKEFLEKPNIFGDIGAHIVDEQLKLYAIVPAITAGEAEAILSSGGLPLSGLCQEESRKMFYALSRLGIDFHCLNGLAIKPEQSQIILRLLLNIDDLTKKMCARAHLVTKIQHGDFSDEVEIKATGSLPTVHILATKEMNEERFNEEVKMPEFLLRPHQNEKEARSFLFHLGASPARLHDGFELTGQSAFDLLKKISQKDGLPSYLELDENARPEIIELDEIITVKIKAESTKPNRIDLAISLSPEFDQTKAALSLLNKAKENILVLDEDTMVILNDKIMANVRYFIDTFGFEYANEYKNKSVAQVALLLNALKDRIRLECNDELRLYLENFSINTKEDDRVLPQGLKATLRPYQHDAVAWLSSLNRSGLGGLLGDEMGLGKTLMVLTHLARMKEFGFSNKPALVVCPTSVIDVWKEEAAQHIPGLVVVKWHGPERAALMEDAKNCDILITSYALLRRDIDAFLKDIEFSTLVLDEAQYVRNQQTDSFKAAKAIKCTHRIALTGTPIENHVGDLYNILDCVEDGILGSRTRFEKQFANPIESGLSNYAFNLKMLLAPVLTRRRKAEVESELPEKIENIVHCHLSPEQKTLYRQYVGQLSGILGKSLNREGGYDASTHFSLLSALTRLRQICCHPSLILGAEAHHQSSGKLKALKEIMSECLEMGRKIIVYSQFLKMQELIVELAQSLDEQGALWLHGSSLNRDEIVKTFQSENGPKIIVVSLKAGGTGITLTQADTVIFADPWWNPAVEDQAIDRAHRIGQKKTVHVIRLIAEDSIECEVVALAQRKRLAAQTVLQDGFKNAANLTRDEVRGLLLKEIDRIEPSTSIAEEAYDLD